MYSTFSFTCRRITIEMYGGSLEGRGSLDRALRIANHTESATGILASLN